MYSPVAAAQTLPGASAEIDRYLLQQYAPYRGLDMQIGAMVIERKINNINKCLRRLARQQH
jgi:hypothetical protein